MAGIALRGQRDSISLYKVRAVWLELEISQGTLETENPTAVDDLMMKDRCIALW